MPSSSTRKRAPPVQGRAAKGGSSGSRKPADRHSIVRFVNVKSRSSSFGRISCALRERFIFAVKCDRPARSSKDFIAVLYVSTRGEARKLGFADALLAGLARDGGLYVPETTPQMAPAAIEALAGAPYGEAAARVILPYVDD